MKQYLDLLRDIQVNGTFTGDRTGTGTQSVFGRQLKFDLREGFPLITTKKIFTKAIIHELLWFISGDTNIRYLNDNGVRIWDEWADVGGDLGPIYGAQWRNYEGVDGYGLPCGIDQLAEVIEGLKSNPNGRRHIISAWNVPLISDMALPPCHCLMQFKVYDGVLHLQLYQRSADVFLGVPFNIASYALLLAMVAQVTGLEAGEFIHTFGDVHIYNNHQGQVALQTTRTPKPLPTLWLRPEIKDIEEFTFDDIQIKDYDYHPAIKGEVSV